MKYYKHSTVIEAISFNELVQHGIDSGANIVNGMPWSFFFRGHPITHENNDCYLIPAPTVGSLAFTRKDILTICDDDSLFPMELKKFHAIYTILPETYDE